MGRKISVLSVCGSGIVTSSMISNRIKDYFTEEGYDISVSECNPSELDVYLSRSTYNFIAYSTQIPDDLSIPKIDALPLITGFGADEFYEKAMEIVKKGE
ncbi:MAG: PTS sugar transporter subunit IIB [Erysipelotrichaceae bacterium]